MRFYRETISQPAFGDAAVENFNHSGVDLNGDDLVCSLQELESEISGAGTDLENGIGGLNASFSDYGVEDTWVGEDVLASALV